VYFSKTTRRIGAKFFLGLRRKHFFITTCINKQCTRPFKRDKKYKINKIKKRKTKCKKLRFSTFYYSFIAFVKKITELCSNNDTFFQFMICKNNPNRILFRQNMFLLHILQRYLSHHCTDGRSYNRMDRNSCRRAGFHTKILKVNIL